MLLLLAGPVSSVGGGVSVWVLGGSFSLFEIFSEEGSGVVCFLSCFYGLSCEAASCLVYLLESVLGFVLVR